MFIIETPFMEECYKVLGFYRAGNDEAMSMALQAEYEAQQADERKAMDEADKASWEAERGIGLYIPFSEDEDNLPF